MNENVKELLKIIDNLDTYGVLICGTPEAVDKVMEIIENGKERFTNYEFRYYANEEFNQGSHSDVYVIPYEKENKSLLFIDNNEYVDITEETVRQIFKPD